MPGPTPSVRLEGYAIVSADGFIADRQGRMPAALQIDADWAYFQAALDRADLTLLGRLTHEAAPNQRRRRRLVISREAGGLSQTDDVTWWIDPAKADIAMAIQHLTGANGQVAVVGGTALFDLILRAPGYAAFHLSVAREVSLGEGRPLFHETAGLEESSALLERSGLKLARRRWLDRASALELLIYEKPGEMPTSRDDSR